MIGVDGKTIIVKHGSSLREVAWVDVMRVRREWEEISGVRIMKMVRMGSDESRGW